MYQPSQSQEFPMLNIIHTNQPNSTTNSSENTTQEYSAYTKTRMRQKAKEIFELSEKCLTHKEYQSCYLAYNNTMKDIVNLIKPIAKDKLKYPQYDANLEKNLIIALTFLTLC